MRWVHALIFTLMFVTSAAGGGHLSLASAIEPTNNPRRETLRGREQWKLSTG